jgi:hypothetical protein
MRPSSRKRARPSQRLSAYLCQGLLHYASVRANRVIALDRSRHRLFGARYRNGGGLVPGRPRPRHRSAIEAGIASQNCQSRRVDRKARLKRYDGLCRLPATRRPLGTIERGLVMFGVAERRGVTPKPAARSRQISKIGSRVMRDRGWSLTGIRIDSPGAECLEPAQRPFLVGFKQAPRQEGERSASATPRVWDNR